MDKYFQKIFLLIVPYFAPVATNSLTGNKLGYFEFWYSGLHGFWELVK